MGNHQSSRTPTTTTTEATATTTTTTEDVLSNLPTCPSSTTQKSMNSSIGYASSSVSSVHSSVHENLMRRHEVLRDPMRFYEIVQILGQGSMGNVAKVRKRDRMRGGSARQEFVTEEKRLSDRLSQSNKCCWVISCPIPRMTPVKDVLKVLPISKASSSTWSSTLSPSSNSDSVSIQPTFQAASNTKAPPHRSNSSIITYGNKKDALYALKSIHLDCCTSKDYQRELENEVKILRTLDHPNIAKALETFHYQGRLFIVLELCSGGDLYQRDPYTQDEAARIMRDILGAVAYLHYHNIVHRDLKFENIMFTDHSKHANVKLIDFGLSQKFAANEHLKDAVGTVYTMAPELIAGDYDAKVDVWSCGVIAFMLLSSSLPFYGKSRTQVLKKIVSGKYSYGSRRWQTIDTEAKVFVRDLLESDPSKRPTAEGALKLAWLDIEEDLKASSTPFNLDETFDNIQAHMHAFAGYNWLKKLALIVIAYQSTSDEIGVLKTMFKMYDRNNNGEITLDEFKATLAERYAYTNAELEAMFKAIDVDGTGIVHYCEFLASTLESHGSIDEHRLAEAFDRLDADDEGYITVQDLRDFVGPEVPESYLDAIIDESDLLRDHRISYDEFLSLWNTESDDKIKSAKQSIRLKRLNSATGSGSSIWSTLSSETDLSFGSIDSSILPEHAKGTAYFEKAKKEMSQRGGQWT